MSLYRATFVLRPEVEEQERNSTVKEVQDFVVSQNGRIENVQSGMQKFAFEVDKANKGFFVSIVFEADASKIHEIHQFLMKKRRYMTSDHSPCRFWDDYFHSGTNAGRSMTLASK